MANDRVVDRRDPAHEELENRLEQLKAECARLREENTQLKERLSLPLDAPAQSAPTDVTAFLDQASPASEKFELFQQLFRGREESTRCDGKTGSENQAILLPVPVSGTRYSAASLVGEPFKSDLVKTC